MLLVLIVLTIYRDKFEKKISSSYEPSKLHFGRAILTPLVYVSFTVMMILEQSMGSFLVATVFQLGYFYFYYDEAMLLLMGTRPSEDQSIALFTERGDINISVTNFMAVIGILFSNIFKRNIKNIIFKTALRIWHIFLWWILVTMILEYIIKI